MTGPCPATTGDTLQVHGDMNFPCELPADGHEWHTRESAPIRVKWRDLPGGGRQFARVEAIEAGR